MSVLGDRWSGLRETYTQAHSLAQAESRRQSLAVGPADTRSRNEYERVIASVTDVDKNAADIMGNGDQTLLSDANGGQALRNVWSTGCDFKLGPCKRTPFLTASRWKKCSLSPRPPVQMC